MHRHPHRPGPPRGVLAGLVTALLGALCLAPPAVADPADAGTPSEGTVRTRVALTPAVVPPGGAAWDVREEPGRDVTEEAGRDVQEEAGRDVTEEAGRDVQEEAGGDVTEEAGGDVTEKAGRDAQEGAGAAAQEETGGAAYRSLETDAPTQAATLELEGGVSVLGLQWDAAGEAVPALRVRQEGGPWSEWHPMPTVGGVEEGDDTAATEGNLVVGPAEVQVRITGGVQDAVVEAWTTTATEADTATVAELTVAGSTADDASTVAQHPAGGAPLIVGTRRDWGADESLRGTTPKDLVAETAKLGVTVHHTTGSNTYTAEQVPAVIRSIYAYHAQTLGWGDVGYGLLVDRFGRAWEGRAGGVDQNIQLAHATGMNRDWQGISVLGDHDDAPVPDAVMATLASLTAWTLDTHGADATASVDYTNHTLGWTRTLPVVHGHQDVIATLCPGYRLYSRLPELRQLAADLQGEVTGVQRVGGADRYVVAARLAQDAFLEGTGTAYLASGESLPDALGVGPVADAQGAAVLLTRRDALPQASALALAALGVQEVVLVGGETAIDEAVAEDLLARGYAVRRVGGADRYATAAMLATSRATPGDGAEDPVGGTAYVANGVQVADALGGAAAAAEVGGTLLLTRPTGLPGATATALRELNPSRVVVLGGEGAVEAAVLDQLGAVVPGAAVERVGGSDRYRTSALVARDAFPSARSAVVASGQAPVDAIAGTQLASRYAAPVVLSRTTCLPAAVASVYDDLGITLSRLAGGTDVLAWEAGSATC